MKGKTSFAFLLVLTVFALGLLAIHNPLRTGPWVNVANAVGTNPGDTMVSNQGTNANYPIAPRIESDTWLNSPKLNWDDLRGKVVLVEFWTFG